MKRLTALIASALMVLSAGSIAAAGPSQGGFASDNVEYLGFLPFDVGTSTGVTIDGDYMYLTSWKNISIYDISDPTAPALTAIEPVGFMFENENVALSPNGDFLLFSESLPGDALHIYNVEDKSDIVPLATLEGAGDHTMSCILKCKYGYGSDGTVVDLRNPAEPKLIGPRGSDKDWRTLATGQAYSNHDITEVKNGFVLDAPINGPFHYIDARDPLKPKLLALGAKAQEEGWLFHSAEWPRNGKDKIILTQGEEVLAGEPTCDDLSAPFLTYDARNWKKTKTFTELGKFRVTNGTYVDGKPAVNGFGCSTHWFEEHPTFKNGGLVAIAWYEHGTRFLDVSLDGKIKEVGHFLPHAGATSAAYWVSEKKNADIVYAADYQRGLDIIRYTAKP